MSLSAGSHGQRLLHSTLPCHGKDVAVVIDPSHYESLLEAQEELEDIAAFDAAMEDKSPNIPWAQVQKDLQLT